MNQSMRRMIEEKFPENQDRSNIIRLVELAIQSPKDVKIKAEEIIDSIVLEEESEDVN